MSSPNPNPDPSSNPVRRLPAIPQTSIPNPNPGNPLSRRSAIRRQSRSNRDNENLPAYRDNENLPAYSLEAGPSETVIQPTNPDAAVQQQASGHPTFTGHMASE